MGASVIFLEMSTKSTSRRARRRSRPVSSGQDWDRRHLPGLQLHESEKLLVGFLGFLLLFLPWALGSTLVLPQAIALCIAILSLGAALLPRHGETHTVTSGGQFRRLLSFPVFWFGLLFLGLLSIQGFNTSHLVEGTEEFRFLTEQESLSFLPTGIAALFTESNAFRSLVIAATPFFGICAAWIGLTRRKSIHLLLTLLAVNGLAIAALAFHQVAKGQALVLWFYEPPASIFFGPFLFHWQAAAFLTVVMAAVVGMAAHHYARARRSFRRSNPSGLFIFIALALMLISIFSSSRAAAAISGGMLAAFVAHIGYRELTAETFLSRKIFVAVSGVVLVAIGMLIVGNVASNYLEQRELNRKVSAPIASFENWEASRAISLSLFKEKPLFGWGGGSFPHLYQDVAEREEIENAPETLEAEYAASDWFRMLAEFGIVGSLLLLLPFLYLLKHFFRAHTFQNPLIGFLLLGVASGSILILGSPLLQNSAFTTTWLLLLTFGAVLIRVESAAKSRAEMRESDT